MKKPANISTGLSRLAKSPLPDGVSQGENLDLPLGRRSANPLRAGDHSRKELSHEVRNSCSSLLFIVVFLMSPLALAQQIDVIIDPLGNSVPNASLACEGGDSKSFQNRATLGGCTIITQNNTAYLKLMGKIVVGENEIGIGFMVADSPCQKTNNGVLAPVSSAGVAKVLLSPVSSGLNYEISCNAAQ